MPLLTYTPDASNIAKAADMLRNGQLVSFPTETVYGLGAWAEDDGAVQRIFATKGRPSSNPLIVHVANKEMAQRYGVFNDTAHKLADAFFPSALTLVVPVKQGAVSEYVLAGNDTVALRAPNHDVAQGLLRALDAGIAAPSANRSGKISPTCATHVLEEFSHKMHDLAMILDGGATPIGLESTVVECCEEGARILRVGSVLPSEIKAVVPLVHGKKTPLAFKSPGMLASHYAPDATLRLNATEVREGEALLAFGKPLPCDKGRMLNLSAKADVAEAATNLYDYLRQLDAKYDRIAVMPMSELGIGEAVNDRLQRAAAE